MEKLIELMANKLGYTMVFISGFLFPGMLFVFIWKRSMYIDLEIVRLIILALVISFSVFIGTFLATSFSFMIQEKAGDRKEDSYTIIGTPIVFADLEIYCGLIYKLSNSHFSIAQFVNIIVWLDFLILIVGCTPSLFKLLWRRVLKRK